MKAMNFMKIVNIKGQRIIKKSQSTLVNNKFKIIDLIRFAIVTFKTDIEVAKELIINAYDLIQESLSHTYICVEGLQPLVFNEIKDAENYNQLSNFYDRLYEDIYVQLFILAKEKFEDTNILSFQRAKISRSLANMYNEICLMEPLQYIS